ncbi:hypothetical protein PGTUg99_018959 [Puccinia graminis f. sp. tritici]|uniref:Secreted protein n=1 Tax=Puccinia graminis f. sp. tritici TaxID=56615 RepID=A0A5B0RXB7_PUCGR|nr:hypothetical protein PGTUg99_018959 [Puccinia graminis f. sp. tritici]
MQFSTLSVLSMTLLFLTYQTSCFTWVCYGTGTRVCSRPVSEQAKKKYPGLKDFWVLEAAKVEDVKDTYTCDDVLPGYHPATRGWCCTFNPPLKSDTMTTADLYQCMVGYKGPGKRSTID